MEALLYVDTDGHEGVPSLILRRQDVTQKREEFKTSFSISAALYQMLIV